MPLPPEYIDPPDDVDADGWDDPELDAEFPLGDGTAETAAVVHCPHCGEPVEIALDPGGGVLQQYVEDCEICCRPWQVTVAYQEDGGAVVTLDVLDS